MHTNDIVHEGKLFLSGVHMCQKVLKERMIEAPMLALLDFKKVIKVECDASRVAISVGLLRGGVNQ
jgi:hypothetical protein